MTLENVAVRGIPDERCSVNQTLSYQLADVHAVVYAGSDEEKWALISFVTFDAWYDDIGWVKLSDLLEYTEESKKLLRYPVQVTEDCVDLKTGEAVKWDAFEVIYEEDYAVLTREGGRSYTVDPKYIVYPSFEK